MPRFARALLVSAALALGSGCAAGRGNAGPAPSAAPPRAAAADGLPDPVYHDGITARIAPADLPHLRRAVRGLVGDAPIQEIAVKLVGHPIDFPAIKVRLAPRPLGGEQFELAGLLVYHTGWLGKHRTLSCPPEMLHGPFCSTSREVSRCRAFRLQSSYRNESFRPLLICVEGEATHDEVRDLLRRIERLDFTSTASGPLPILDLDTITRIERTIEGKTVLYRVTFSRERLRWSVVVFALSEGKLRVVRASSMIS